MQNASNPLQKRKRGGQPGNRNRLIHGRYSNEEAAWREKMRGYRRKGKALVILVDNVLKARKALKRRRALLAAHRANAPQHSILRSERTTCASKPSVMHVEAAPIATSAPNCHGPPSAAPSAQFA
jgi:hypothetical protein